jgi:hypothetical protein
LVTIIIGSTSISINKLIITIPDITRFYICIYTHISICISDTFVTSRITVIIAITIVVIVVGIIELDINDTLHNIIMIMMEEVRGCSSSWDWLFYRG